MPSAHPTASWNLFVRASSTVVPSLVWVVGANCLKSAHRVNNRHCPVPHGVSWLIPRLEPGGHEEDVAAGGDAVRHLDAEPDPAPALVLVVALSSLSLLLQVLATRAEHHELHILAHEPVPGVRDEVHPFWWSNWPMNPAAARRPSPADPVVSGAPLASNFPSKPLADAVPRTVAVEEVVVLRGPPSRSMPLTMPVSLSPCSRSKGARPQPPMSVVISTRVRRRRR